MAHHVVDVVDALVRGRVVPFLGAGVNLSNSVPSPATPWSLTSESLPSGSDLAHYLAEQFRYPIAEECGVSSCPLYQQQSNVDLARVSQYGATRLGPGALYAALGEVFDRQYTLTDVHRFLASLTFPAPQARLAWGRHILIVSTNYDDLMERAFGDQPFDLVFYDPENTEPGGSPRGRFLHRAPGKEPVAIDRPNEYDYPFLEHRPTLLKIHGTNGYPVVITEDHYIDYLADEAFTKLPKRLLSRICNSHLLFLGYSLRDWNFRVFLRRIKRNRTQDFTSWAVVKSTDEDEKTFWWERARVAIQWQELGLYAASLEEELKKRGVRG